VLENWKQYFNNILKFETQQVKNNAEVPLQDHDEEEIEIPAYKDINNMNINNIISKLKKIKPRTRLYYI
jgi:3'-phosphoadenosine 5'-phosphosulfate sulfotransferase